MDIVTLALAKKFALQVASGFSSISVDDVNRKITFTMNDGQQASLVIPTVEVPVLEMPEISPVVDEDGDLTFINHMMEEKLYGGD